MRYVAHCFVLLVCIGHTFAQGQVTVTNAGDRELKFTARRLRISIDNLKTARDILKETIQLAVRLDSLPPHSISALAQTAIRVDRKNAASWLPQLYLSFELANRFEEELAIYALELARSLVPLVENTNERSWKLISLDVHRARAFEKYLKTGSGRAFF